MRKYAAMMGGAHNHRMGLFDAILIKDNHIAIAGGIAQAIKAAKNAPSSSSKSNATRWIRSRPRSREGVDRILLDNMTTDMMREAVRRAGDAELEASGNVTLESIREIAKTGVTTSPSAGSRCHRRRSISGWISKACRRTRRSALYVLSAVDHDLGAGHVARLVGAEIIDRLGHFLGLAEPAQRDVLHDFARAR